MKLENQVVSLELAQQLKKLGVKQESLFYWENKWAGSSDDDAGKDVISYSNSGYHTMRLCSAFTVAELGEMLKELTNHKDYTILFADNKQWFWEWKNFGGYADTEADARAKMLIYLLENSLLPTN